jgi:hypothetical protein
VGFKDEASVVRMIGEATTPMVDDFSAFADAVRDGQ